MFCVEQKNNGWLQRECKCGRSQVPCGAVGRHMRKQTVCPQGRKQVASVPGNGDPAGALFSGWCQGTSQLEVARACVAVNVFLADYHCRASVTVAHGAGWRTYSTRKDGACMNGCGNAGKKANQLVESGKRVKVAGPVAGLKNEACPSIGKNVPEEETAEMAICSRASVKTREKFSNFAGNRKKVSHYEIV